MSLSQLHFFIFSNKVIHKKKCCKGTGKFTSYKSILLEVLFLFCIWLVVCVGLGLFVGFFLFGLVVGLVDWFVAACCCWGLFGFNTICSASFLLLRAPSDLGVLGFNFSFFPLWFLSVFRLWAFPAYFRKCMSRSHVVPTLLLHPQQRCSAFGTAILKIPYSLQCFQSRSQTNYLGQWDSPCPSSRGWAMVAWPGERAGL